MNLIQMSYMKKKKCIVCNVILKNYNNRICNKCKKIKRKVYQKKYRDKHSKIKKNNNEKIKKIKKIEILKFSQTPEYRLNYYNKNKEKFRIRRNIKIQNMRMYKEFYEKYKDIIPK